MATHDPYEPPPEPEPAPAPAPESGSGSGSASEAGPDRERLLAEWCELLGRAREDGARAPEPRAYGEELLERWSAPERRYHSIAHLRAVLDRVRELAAHAAPSAAPRSAPPSTADSAPDSAGDRSGDRLDVDAVLLAAWFHDAVYLPWRSENEERSARLAERALPEAGVPAARTEEVARLVRLTVDHDPAEGDANGEVLSDADLAVLAGTPEQYARYASEVRAEYAFVPDADFRAGRAGVLRQLLGLPRLFRTSYGYGRWEAAARHNLRTELELLAGDD